MLGVPAAESPHVRHVRQVAVATSAAEDVELAALLERQDCAEPLADFIGRITPRWPSPDHVKPLRDLFEEARHHPVRALISMPPRHAKTVTIQHGLAWFLADAPRTRSAFISATARFAQRRSKEIQKYARAAGANLASEAVDWWTTTAGGGLLATGIDGQYIGEGTTGIQVIDDPYENAAAAASPVVREHVWDWLISTAMNRAEPGCSQIIQHQRWHPDDVIGRLLREERHRWRYINLPAVDGFNEDVYEAFKRGGVPLEEVGSPLWPGYYPLTELLPFMRSKHFWWAQYMGEPRVRGARVFESEPGRFVLPGFSIHGMYAAIGVDPAGTKKTRADHTAIVVGAMSGVGDQAKLHILDVIRMQETIPVVVRRLRDVQAQRNLLIVVEAVAGFKAVPQMLRDIDPKLRIREIVPSVDKFIRAQPVADAWNEGRVLVPEHAPWVNEFLTEFERFTGVDDDEDDQVDATAHLWNALYKPAPARDRHAVREATGPFG